MPSDHGEDPTRRDHRHQAWDADAEWDDASAPKQDRDRDMPSDHGADPTRRDYRHQAWDSNAEWDDGMEVPGACET